MRIGARGQIVVPRHLLERYELHQNEEIEFIPEDGGIRIQKPPREIHPPRDIRGIAKLRYADSVDEYIEEIRGR